MPAIKSLAIGFMAFMLTGCGQLISEKLAVSDSTRMPTCTGKKLVILPFADYSYAEDAERAFKRNLIIMENLSARLSANGFRMPIQEDLLQYLADSGIVKVGTELTTPGRPGYLQDVIATDESWSADMKKEMAQIAYKDSGEPKADNRSKGLALDQPALAKIAGNFNADFIMRGRITQFELDAENTWDPLKRGLLPVVFGGTNRAMFGVTNSETYDMFGSMLAGAALGGVIGTQTSIPYDETEKLNPERFNSMAWGLGGAALGYMSSKGGHANQAAVQLRLWVQDPKSGEVIWTNSVKVLVKPQTIFAETREDKLFDTAVTQAVAALTKDFVKNAKAVL
jgi:hypothetical protein